MRRNREKSVSDYPRMESQLFRVGDNVLELQTWNQDAHSGFGWLGCWFFILLGFPAMVFMTLASTEFIARDKVKWGAFSWDDVEIGIGIVVFLFSLTLGYAMLNARALKRFSPLHFNRRTGKLYATAFKQLFSADWTDVEIKKGTNTLLIDEIFQQSSVLRFTLHAENPSKKLRKVAIAIFCNTSAQEGEPLNQGAASVYEYIRRFMQDGPDELMVPGEYWVPGENSYISIPARLALKKHRPWPIYQSVEPDLGLKLVAPLVFVYKIVFFIPNVMAEILWRAIYTAAPAKGEKIPADSLADGKDCITPLQVSGLLEKGQDAMLYTEAKQRLGVAV